MTDRPMTPKPTSPVTSTRAGEEMIQANRETVREETIEECAKWHDDQAAMQRKFRDELDRYSNDREERAAWVSRRNKEDTHKYCAKAIRSLSPLKE